MDLFKARSLLKINKHDLDSELERNAQVGEEIGREVAVANTAQLRLKRDLEATEAQVIASLKDADAKMTNPIAEKEAKRNPRYLKGWDAYHEARQLYEEWDAIYKSWIGRGYDLKALGQLFSDQYFAINSVTGPAQRDYERDQARAIMRERTGDHSRRQEKEIPEVRPRRRSLDNS